MPPEWRQSGTLHLKVFAVYNMFQGQILVFMFIYEGLNRMIRSRDTVQHITFTSDYIVTTTKHFLQYMCIK